MDLDYAKYLLNFERIELAVTADGHWHVYYRHACRFLDRKTFGCTVRGTAKQPHVCSQYNPYQCWYRPALEPDTSQDLLRLDRARLQFVLDRVAFDEDRNLVEVPSWDVLTDAFSDMPMRPGDDFDPDPVEGSMLAIRNGTQPRPGDGSGQTELGYQDPLVIDPCQGCAAYCCRVVMFPFERPESLAALDYVRFALGFPGIELVMSDEQWALGVRSTCRHLEEGKCSVFGQAERPLRCQFYDAWSCSYKPLFGDTRPVGQLRIALEEFAVLADCFGFDESGAVIAFPSTESVRQGVERFRDRTPDRDAQRQEKHVEQRAKHA